MKTQDYRLTTLHFAREWSWRRMLETLLKRTLLHARKLWTKETITGSSRSSKFLDLLNFESRACFIGQLKNKEIEFYALRPLYCLSLHKIIPKTFNFWSSNRFNEKSLSNDSYEKFVDWERFIIAYTRREKSIETCSWLGHVLPFPQQNPNLAVIYLCFRIIRGDEYIYKVSKLQLIQLLSWLHLQ